VATADVAGVTGRLRFDKVGDRRTGVAVMEVETQAEGDPRTRLRGWVGER
jgi:hypothetical protein